MLFCPTVKETTFRSHLSSLKSLYFPFCHFKVELYCKKLVRSSSAEENSCENANECKPWGSMSSFSCFYNFSRSGEFQEVLRFLLVPLLPTYLKIFHSHIVRIISEFCFQMREEQRKHYQRKHNQLHFARFFLIAY